MSRLDWRFGNLDPCLALMIVIAILRARREAALMRLAHRAVWESNASVVDRPALIPLAPYAVFPGREAFHHILDGYTAGRIIDLKPLSHPSIVVLPDDNTQALDLEVLCI